MFWNGIIFLEGAALSRPFVHNTKYFKWTYTVGTSQAKVFPRVLIERLLGLVVLTTYIKCNLKLTYKNLLRNWSDCLRSLLIAVLHRSTEVGLTSRICDTSFTKLLQIWRITGATASSFSSIVSRLRTMEPAYK